VQNRSVPVLILQLSSKINELIDVVCELSNELADTKENLANAQAEEKAKGKVARTKAES
jgi:hypothetical protein